MAHLRGVYSPLVGDAATESMVTAMRGPGTGTPEQVIGQLARLKDLGCEYLICYFPEAAHDHRGLELFERAVIPALS